MTSSDLIRTLYTYIMAIQNTPRRCIIRYIFIGCTIIIYTVLPTYKQYISEDGLL
jgi:hypothetical protein